MNENTSISLHSYRKHRGSRRLRFSSGIFTMIELLTVITILGILVSLLLPALGTSLKSTRSVHCLGNLKQLNTAFMQYAEENCGCFPLGISRQASLEHGGTNWARYIFPYLQNNRVFDCPVSPDPAPQPTASQFHLYDGNYGWNFDGTQGRYGPFAGRIKDCSATYLLFDSGDQCITYWSNKWESLMEELDLDWDSGKEGCNRHEGRVNICFLDSHAASRSLPEFLAAPNPSYHAPWHIKWSDSVLQPGIVPFPDR